MKNLSERMPAVDRALFILFAGSTAFMTYFAMYAFRKPFTATSYASVTGWHFLIDFKIALVIAQVAGYAVSKFIGLKVVSEMDPRHRAIAIVGLIVLSWFALVLFAVAPTNWKPAALFLNGLPLGMIWGLVFGYLEGRRASDVLGAMLCASFIVSSGMVKSTAAWLMNTLHITELWMPAATGALFFPLLLVSVLGLSRIPPPTQQDMAERMPRLPMRAPDRMAFLSSYWPGLTMLTLAYTLFTVIRDFRDNFAAEIWTDLGYGGVSSVFTASEAPIAIVTLVILGLLVLIRNNRHALMAMNVIILSGSCLILASTYAFQSELISPIVWMILSGTGLYFAYTPFNAMFFDRLLAASGRIGNAGFLIYVADASGYLGSVALMLFKNFGSFNLDWKSFFIGLCYVGAVCSAVLMAGSYIYFSRRLKRASSPKDGIES